MTNPRTTAPDDPPRDLGSRSDEQLEHLLAIAGDLDRYLDERLDLLNAVRQELAARELSLPWLDLVRLWDLWSIERSNDVLEEMIEKISIGLAS